MLVLFKIQGCKRVVKLKSRKIKARNDNKFIVS